MCGSMRLHPHTYLCATGLCGGACVCSRPRLGVRVWVRVCTPATGAPIWEGVRPHLCVGLRVHRGGQGGQDRPGVSPAAVPLLWRGRGTVPSPGLLPQLQPSPTTALGHQQPLEANRGASWSSWRGVVLPSRGAGMPGLLHRGPCFRRQAGQGSKSAPLPSASLGFPKCNTG